MLELFYKKTDDNKIALITEYGNLTFSELKAHIAWKIEQLKSSKNDVVILVDNNYDFVINFFASIFSGKNIYLVNDKTKLKTLTFDYDILGKTSKEILENYTFPKIDSKLPCINFYTSGSSSEPKCIKKSLDNMICEAYTLQKELKLAKENYTVVSTTSMCHLFGLTFHLFFALTNRYPIDTRAISSPENLDNKNVILISTPTFLRAIKKYDEPFKIPPQYIFSAGSKLDDKDFQLLEKNSKIVEIYGSSETGVVAYNTHYNKPFKIFTGVNIQATDKYVIVNSNFIYDKEVKIYDNIEIEGDFLKISNRTDRLFKIYEKRVSANELELHLKNNNLVNDCYITKHKEKLVCLCALSETGKEYVLTKGIPRITTELKQYLSNFSEIIPHNWKFIDIIPMTPAGKINKKIIEHIFNTNLSLPVILDRKIKDNCIEYKIFFYNQCNFFKGHFPDFKLLPGVVQLYYAKEFANHHFNLNLSCGQWKRIKFSNIIKPDNIINLRLTKTEKNISYEYFSDTKLYSSGVFLCDNIFKELV